MIWGYAQYNGFWGGLRGGESNWNRARVRASITRRAPAAVGPGFTEDLDRLTDAMVAFGYPGFEHTIGLWFDRRRDEHDTVKRSDDRVVPPFLEQPWARSAEGRAWDGLPKYDLESFNPWYFERLDRFAALAEEKGALLLFDFYAQHPLLESPAHYVDFPWRPANAIQDTAMPDQVPAANAFYDVSHPERRRLHQLYIRNCLDVLGDRSSVVFLVGQEFTGPLPFVEFWIDEILRWEEESGRRVTIGLGATKDVLDAILRDPERGPHVAVVDLRYWWYEPNGELNAPPGGREVPGRFMFGATGTSADQIHRQVLEYRGALPHRAILHGINANRTQTLAFLMAGGSMIVRMLNYAKVSDTEPWRLPDEYVAPASERIIGPTYRFIRTQLAETLPRMRPSPERVEGVGSPMALSSSDGSALVFRTEATPFELNLVGQQGWFRGKWLDASSGEISSMEPGVIEGGRRVRLEPPGGGNWVFWLSPIDAQPTY